MEVPCHNCSDGLRYLALNGEVTDCPVCGNGGFSSTIGPAPAPPRWGMLAVLWASLAVNGGFIVWHLVSWPYMSTLLLPLHLLALVYGLSLYRQQRRTARARRALWALQNQLPYPWR